MVVRWSHMVLKMVVIWSHMVVCWSHMVLTMVVRWSHFILTLTLGMCSALLILLEDVFVNLW